MREILEKIKKVHANWHSYADPEAVIRDLQAQLDEAQVAAIEELQKKIRKLSKVEPKKDGGKVEPE